MTVFSFINCDVIYEYLPNGGTNIVGLDLTPRNGRHN